MDGIAVIDPTMRQEFQKRRSGPWTDEPDRVLGRHVSGLYWLLKRGAAGAWCGYVAVTQDHPAFRHSYDHDILDTARMDVHGGLTFAGPWFGVDQYWWFGFDCSHFNDLTPFLASLAFWDNAQEHKPV